MRTDLGAEPRSLRQEPGLMGDRLLDEHHRLIELAPAQMNLGDSQLEGRVIAGHLRRQILGCASGIAAFHERFRQLSP
jgi:hypothetical protein